MFEGNLDGNMKGVIKAGRAHIMAEYKDFYMIKLFTCTDYL